MLHDKNRQEQHHRATSSALATAIARLWSLVAVDVAPALGSSCGANGEELVQQGLYRTLHDVSSSVAGVRVHGLEQSSEVEAGIPEIEMAEGARQG